MPAPSAVQLRRTHMRASIDSNGLLTIAAESPLEAYALSTWIKEAGMIFDPLASEMIGKETFMWKGSKMLVETSHDVRAETSRQERDK